MVIPWEKTKHKEEEKELQNIEEQLRLLQEDYDLGFITSSTRDKMKRLEARRRLLLVDQEETWRLNSRAIWIENEYENTKLFQSYAKGRREEKTIRILKDWEGRSVTSFEGLSNLGKIHFENLFKAVRRVNIGEIIKVAL